MKCKKNQILTIKNFLITKANGNNGEDGKLASIYLNKNNQVSQVFEVNNLKKNKNLEIPDFGISSSKTQSKNFNLLINILSDLDQESVI